MRCGAFSQPKKPWHINLEIGDQSGPPITGAALLDYQRIDVVLDTKPKAKTTRDPVPPMTPLERLIGRELDADVMEQLDLLANGKKENMELLLEIGLAAGKTYIDETYPDPKFDLEEWRR
jgi:hypothetical protein